MADIKSLIDKFNIFRTKDSILNDVAKDNGQITIDIKQPFSDDIDSNNSLKTKLETNIKDKLFNTEINNIGSNIFDEKIKPFDKGYNVSNTPDTDTKTPIDTTPIKPDTPTIEKNTADATNIQQEKTQQPAITTPKPKPTQQYKTITEQQNTKLTTDSFGNPMPIDFDTRKGTSYSGVGEQQIDEIYNRLDTPEKFDMFMQSVYDAYDQLKSTNLNDKENLIFLPYSYDHENGNMNGIRLTFGGRQKEWAEKQLKVLETAINDKQNEEWLRNLELPQPETTMDKIRSKPWLQLFSFIQPPTDGMEPESASKLESGQKENRLNAIKWDLINNINECKDILDKYYKDKSQVGTALSQKNIAETINNVIFPQIDLVKQSEIASIISKYKKNPKSLTPIENEIVKYYSDYVNALSVVANKTSTGYETIKAIETSLPFMADFLRFNLVGSATRGGTRAAMKLGGKGLAKQIAKDTPKTIGARAFKLGEDILTAAGHTSVSPLTFTNMLEDYSQTMETNGQYTKNDLRRGVIEAFTENFSERMFGALKGIVPKSNNAFVNSLFGNNPVIKSMQKHMNVGGMFEETAEEYAGAFLNTMFGFALGDKKLSSSFKEQLNNSIPTILSIGITVGLPQAIGMGIDFREIRNTNKRFNVAEDNLKQYFNKENSYLDINRYSDALKSLYINLNNAKYEEDKAEIKGKIAELNKTAANLAMEKGDSNGFNLISEYSIAAQNSFYVTNKAMSELKNMSEEDRTKLSDNAINKLKNDFTNNLNWSLISRAAAKNITDQNGKQHPTCFLYTDNGVTYVLNGQKDNMFSFVDVNGNTISKSADELRNNDNLSVLHLNNLLSSFSNKELEDINSKFIDIAQYNAGYMYKVNDNGEIRYYTDNEDLINSNIPYERIDRDKIESDLVGSYDLVRIDNITNAVEDMANAFTEPAAEQTAEQQPAQETIEQPAQEQPAQEQPQEQTTQEPAQEPAQEQPIQEQTTEEQETTEQEPIQPTQQQIEPTQQEDDSTALNGVPDIVDDTPQDARERGFRRVNGYKIDRQKPLQAVNGKEIAVRFSNDVIANGHVAVIDAEQLQPSHIQGVRNPLHFIDEAQPKERNDEASIVSAQRIAKNIRPEEITSSVTAYTGAPIINTRGETIQGNNRSDALRLMWSQNKDQAEKYKQYLIDHAQEFGLNAEDIAAMERPILVNMIDVSDEDAIALGQYVAQDTESGGLERIKPKNAVQKMGADMRTFANLLLSSNDDEISFAGLIDKNGVDVLNWLGQKGYITPTQYKSAFDTKGYITAEAKNDLRGIMYQSIFQGGSTRLEEMFNTMPAKAQKAILATAFRDYDSPKSESMIVEIQNSIRAYYALSQSADFMNAKTYKDVRLAVEGWKKQYQIDDATGESYLPAENFSNFALLLATMYKGEKQTLIQGTFNKLYDLIQGTQEADLFETPDNTPRTLSQAIKEVLNIDYNGQQRNNVLVGDTATSQRGEQGSTRDAATRERTEDGERTADSAGSIEAENRIAQNEQANTKSQGKKPNIRRLGREIGSSLSTDDFISETMSIVVKDVKTFPKEIREEDIISKEQKSGKERAGIKVKVGLLGNDLYIQYREGRSFANKNKELWEKVKRQYWGTIKIPNATNYNAGQLRYRLDYAGTTTDIARIVSDAVFELFHKKELRLHKGSEIGNVSIQEAALRDALIDKLREAGIDVITDVEDAQRVLDKANGKDIRQQKVYHGSGADFDAFDFSHMGEGTGNKAFGWGGYVSESEGVGRMYVGEKAQLYLIEIPDDNGSNYLHFEKPIGGDMVRKVKDALYQYIVSNDEEETYSDNKSRYALKADIEVIDANAKGGDVYGTVSDFLGGDKQASEFLSSIGFVGISYNTGFRSGETTDNTRNYVIFNENDLKIVDKIRFFRTADGDAYGFTVGGKIYIDQRIATADTPIHEYAHIWASAMQKLNPKEWENIVKLMKGTPIWEEVKRNYPELTTDNEIADEVLAFYSGSRGAERLREEHANILKGNGNVVEKVKAINAIKRVREALKRFWKNVADWFGIHFTTAEEVADKVLSDLLNGVNPTLAGIEDDIRFEENSEEADIVARAKADGTYMKAPNGKQSNLSPRQWVQVRTKAFKDWFGDWENDPDNSSKVVDENGEPMVVYHGSGKWFHVFNGKSVIHKSNAADNTIYMSDNREMAESYVPGHWFGVSNGEKSKTVKDVILDENSPLHKMYSWGISREGGIYTLFANIKYPYVVDFQGNGSLEGIDGMTIDEIVVHARKEGYDGVIAKNIKDVGITDEKDVPLSTDIIAFEPTQIKSATDNVGTFDQNNPDIRYQFVGEKGAAAMDKAEEATIRLDNLAVARDMEKAGKDAKDIKFATGWERGAEGKWRYEILDGKFDASGELHAERRRLSDEEQKELDDAFFETMEAFSKGDEVYTKEITEDTDMADIYEAGGMERSKAERISFLEKKKSELSKKPKTLDDYIDNEELFAAYPELRDLVVEVGNRNAALIGNFGAYSPENNIIRLNDISLSTLSHEVQHAIQYIEGFALGGSKSNVRNTIKKKIKELDNMSEYAKEMLARQVEYGTLAFQLGYGYERLMKNGDEWSVNVASDYYWEAMNTLDNDENSKLHNVYPKGKTPFEIAKEGFNREKAIDELKRLSDYYASLVSEDDKKNIKASDELSKKIKGKSDMELYRAIMGEVEARNVQSRLGMSAEERRRSLAIETEDVERKDQIFLEDGLGVSASEVDKKTNAANSKSDTLYRIVDDKSTIERLDAEPKIKAYRAMQVIDGRLYSPMAAKIDGKLSSDNPFDTWTEAEETVFDFTPEQISAMEELDNSSKVGEVQIIKGKLRYRKDSKTGKGKLQFHLVKGDGTDLWAAYNPYIHNSLMMLNDQFTSAYKRPNIVVVEVEIPESELTSGYRANLAKDAVGIAEWKAGPVASQLPSDMSRKVILSRWSKVKRIVPYSEVADNVAALFSTAEQKNGKKMRLPIDSFHPELRKELEKRGFEFEYGTYTKEKTDKKGNLIKAWDEKTEEEKKQEYNGAAYIDDAAIKQLNDEFGGKWIRREGVSTNDELSQSERQRMAERINELADKLQLDNVEIVTDASTLESNKKRAKGFYSKSTDKITIVIPNHSSVFDAEQTLLHEAVAHYGLRQLFGEHFDTFLDNVFNNADKAIRKRIIAIASKNGFDLRTATEEYLATLAENTEFEAAQRAGWWQKIKDLFLNMLHRIGFEDFGRVTLTDNELRYILWRSYENLANGNNSILGDATDDAKQKELGVGNYAATNKNSTTTNENDIRYRRASNRSVISSRFERQAEIQREEKNTKSAANIVLGNANVVLNDTNIFDEQYQNAIDNNLIDENVSPLIDSFGITWGYQLKNGVIVINKDVFVSDILDKRVKDNLSLLISSLMKTNKTFFKEGISFFKKLPIWVLYKNDTKSNEDTIKEIINDILLGNTSIDTNKLELLKQYTVQDMNDILDNATKWFEKFEGISSNMFAGNSISDILDTTLGDLMPKEITTTQEGKRLNWFSKLGIDIRSKLFDSLDWFRVVSDKTKDKTASELYDAMIVHTKRVQGKIDIFDKEYVRPIIDTIQSMLGKDFGNSTLSLDLIQEYFAIKSLLGRTASLYKEKFGEYLANPDGKKPQMFDEFKQIYDEITEDEIKQRINEMGEKSSMSILQKVDIDYLMEEVRRTLAAEMFVKQYVYSSANTLNQGLQGEQSLGLINEVTNEPYSELYQLLYSDEQSSQTMHSPIEIIEQADILIDRAGLRKEFDFIGNQIQAILNYVNIERVENGLMSYDTFAKRQLMKDFVNQRGENSSEGNLYEITAKQKANEKMKGKDWFNPNSITSIIAVAQTEIATMEKELLAQRLSYFLTNPNNFDVLSQYGMIIDEKETLNEELSEDDRNYIMDKNIVLLYGDRHTDKNTKGQVDKKKINILKRNDDGTFTKVTISFDNKFIGLEEFVKFVNNNFKYEELRGISKAVAPFTAWTSRIYTILSPLFPTKNLFKDLMVTPWLPAKELNGKNSQYAIKNFYNAFNNLSFILKMSFTEKSFSKKGFENKLKARSQELFEYYLEYSKQHSIFSIEDQIGALSKENKTLQDIERALSGKENKFIKFTERALLIKFMQHYAELFENLHKFSAYVTLRKLGYGEERSAQIANNATLNYDRSGSIGRQLNAIIPFAKAALGGLYRTNYLLPKYNPKGFLQRVITLAVLGVMQGLMYDPDDDDISEFARKSGMVFGSFLYPLLPEELSIVRPVRALVIVMAGKKSPAYFKQELMESTIDLVPIASDALRGAFSYNPLTNKTEFDVGQILANTDKMTAVYALAMLALYINENKNSFGKNVLLNEETNTDKTRYGRTKQDYGLYDYLARLYNSILNGVDIDDRAAMSNKIGKNGERLMTIAKEDVEFVINNYIPFGRLYAYTAEIIYDAVNDKRINKGHIPLIGGLFAQKSFGKDYYLVNNIKYELKDFTNDFSQSQIEDIKTNILVKADNRYGIRYKALKDNPNANPRMLDRAKRNMNEAFNLFILDINNLEKTDFTEDEQKFMLKSFLDSPIMKKALSIGEDTLNKNTAKRVERTYKRYKKYNNENIDTDKENMNEAAKNFKKMLYDKSITEEEFNNKLNSLWEPMTEQIKLRAKFAGYSIE